MITPVIHFDGNCKEAIELYERAFTVIGKQIHYYRQAPESSTMLIDECTMDLIMHSTLTICGTKFNMSDSLDDVKSGDMVCFNVFLDSEEEVKNAFNVLSKEGQIVQEMCEEFFARMYTVIIDKFGIRWQIMYTAE